MIWSHVQTQDLHSSFLLVFNTTKKIVYFCNKWDFLFLLLLESFWTEINASVILYIGSRIVLSFTCLYRWVDSFLGWTKVFEEFWVGDSSVIHLGRMDKNMVFFILYFICLPRFVCFRACRYVTIKLCFLETRFSVCPVSGGKPLWIYSEKRSTYKKVR